MHEVEKVVLTDLGFICILQKGTCGCYHRAIGRLPITRIYITYIYSVGYEHSVSWVIVFLQWNTRFSGSGPPTFWILPQLYELCKCCLRSPVQTFEWESFEHWRTMYFSICYFASVISQRCMKYTLVHSSKLLAQLLYVHLI